MAVKDIDEQISYCYFKISTIVDQSEKTSRERRATATLKFLLL